MFLPRIHICLLTSVPSSFSDCQVGVATQCLKAQKCFRAKAQYYANVMLKYVLPQSFPRSPLTSLRVNVKLGGVNAVPEARSVPILSDPQNPAIIIGADVIHPAPGVENKPSFTSMVANIDPMYSRYIAISKVQKSRQEIIDDTEEMVKVGALVLCVHQSRSQGL